MTISEAIQYLQPIADSASLPRYTEALNTAIAAMKYQKERIAESSKTIDHVAEVGKMDDHIREVTKKVGDGNEV